ncbi:hypothetical protein LEP1GSC133_1016 [Leptospira borgpetersenii serovar Pomona str. 200901868]|uniref:Uncharacterized protein n=2 Tax=Leptospira borgpetersenii TaxID=174 RepID=M3FHC4_LEPBO|nr:hypothetical protein LEP1GSC123_0730 [Leptospira borgpetersenii str. 200701203]EMO64074.1 hypothetical protein LEP1GSC133_1016 [Leptospira borgpetersenii serovar Pomona str. 200901868]
MKKAAVSILIFLFLGNLSLFSQDGEEIDFLEKVSEPKKRPSVKNLLIPALRTVLKFPKKRKKKIQKKEV